SIGCGAISCRADGRCDRNRCRFVRGAWSFLPDAVGGKGPPMMYQLGWTTLPGLRGLSCSDFRATPTDSPHNDRGIAIDFAVEVDRDQFLRRAEEHFASRRFTNAADAFDTVKAYAVEWAAKTS